MMTEDTPRRPATLRRNAVLGLVALAALAGPRPVLAQGAEHARAELLVDAGWLAEHGDDATVVVLQTGARSAYEEGHIPGARWLDLGAISVSSDDHGAGAHTMLELPDPLDAAREAFEAAGVSDGSTVVVAFPGDRVIEATRVLWTLEVLGFRGRAALLDGGAPAWSAAGRALTTEEPAITPGRLTPAARMERRASAEWVLAHLEDPGVALVDARARASYDGTRESLPGRAGHIPGAGSLPTPELFDADGLLKPAAELRTLLAAAGVEPGDVVVGYCHIGLMASGLVYAARTLGFETRLYDGSMIEWAAQPDLPLVAPGG
jgi:thiosulfate/3-mercaptopyruvate sulfurtransferase